MGQATHGGSRANLLGPDPDRQAIAHASVELRVDANTPPCFIVHAEDDGTVPVANSLMLYSALVAAKRPGELHIFEEGGHGFGVRLSPDLPASAWPRLFSAYARRKGVFTG
jgi:dipeptidyl aminopeptidase/acylaminoacyl peptidase